MDHNIDMYLEAVTGSIDGQLDIWSNISLNFEVDTVTGVVDVPHDRTGTSGTINIHCDIATGSIDITTE